MIKQKSERYISTNSWDMFSESYNKKFYFELNKNLNNIGQIHCSGIKLNNEIIVDPLDLVVCDVSFISLKKVLVPSMALIKTGGQLLCLFKPQFEIGPGKLKKTGVLNDASMRVQLLKEMEHWFLSMEGWKLQGSTESVLTGRNGNKEFFLLVEKL